MSPTLLLAVVLFGQVDAGRVYPTLKVPSQVSGEAGQPIAITGETNGTFVRFLCPDDAHAVKAAGDKGCVFTTAKAGRYRVYAWTCLADWPTNAQLVWVVVRNPDTEPDPPPQPPPVPPIPPPEPPPPEPKPPAPPADPWVVELQKAFDQDAGQATDKAKWKAALGGFYAAMHEHVAKAEIKTVADLLSDYRAAQPALLPDGVLMAVRRLCGAKVAGVAPTDPDSPLDKPLRDKFAAVFSRLALTLDQVK